MKIRIIGLLLVAVLVAVTQVLLSTAGLSLPDWRAVVIIVIEVLLYLWGYFEGGQYVIEHTRTLNRRWSNG